MRILLVHNYYQRAGGEDQVFRSESDLLRENGDDVREFVRENRDIEAIPPVALALNTIWGSRAAGELAAEIDRFRPDVLHVHNTFPLISPAIYWTAKDKGVPVVQTLHNFRLLCPQAMLLRRGVVCEDCVGRLPWRAVARKCYRDSVAETGVVAAMLTFHRAIRTYERRVTLFIALNAFCRDVFIRGGLPAEKIRVKANFVEDPGNGSAPKEAQFLYVGRLSTEKGIRTLAGALEKTGGPACEVIGTGPEESQIVTARGVRFSGWRDGAYVRQRMFVSTALVVPSIWYENFPRTIVEAFACGLPVVASRIGALASLIAEGNTGLLFEAGNADDLAEKLAWAARHPEEMRRMGNSARALYEREFNPAVNCRALSSIYREAIALGVTPQ